MAHWAIFCLTEVSVAAHPFVEVDSLHGAVDDADLASLAVDGVHLVVVDRVEPA